MEQFFDINKYIEQQDTINSLLERSEKGTNDRRLYNKCLDQVIKEIGIDGIF